MDGTGAVRVFPLLVGAAGNNYLKADCGCCVGVALNLFDLIWDFLKQSFLFIVGVLVLFLIVSRVDNTNFFLQYYAKDQGLVVETLHAARGDVTLPYDKLSFELAFDQHYASKYLALRPSKEGPPKDEEAEEPRWRVRKRYGQDLSVDPSLQGITVAESTLLNPQILVYTLATKQVEDSTGRLTSKRTITVAETADESTPCNLLGERPRRMETLLKVEGNSPLLTEATKIVEDAFRPSANPVVFITFRAVPGEALGLAGEGDAQLASILTCLLSRKLLIPTTGYGTQGSTTTSGVAGAASSAAPSAQNPVSAPGAPNTERRVTVTLTHPGQLPPGLTPEKVATALAQTLEVVLE